MSTTPDTEPDNEPDFSRRLPRFLDRTAVSGPTSPTDDDGEDTDFAGRVMPRFADIAPVPPTPPPPFRPSKGRLRLR